MASYDAGKHTSLWLDTTPETRYGRVNADLNIDVAVVGGGIAGITTAFMLALEGKKVAVLDRERILTGVTGFTTAKLTSNHARLYKHLIDTFGAEKARLYAQANESAIKYIVSYCAERGIDADIQQMPAYTYAATESDTQSIRDEAEAAKSCGLPATYTEDVPLPFRTAGAVKFDNQYIFHPRKYLLAVAEDYIKLGGLIFENTRVSKIEEEDDGCVVTTDGGVVRAKDVVVATNYPIYDPKFFFARLAAVQAYAIAVKLEDRFPAGMFYSTDESGHSLRPHWLGSDKEVVIVGGEEHPVGKGGDIIERYRRLEDWARASYPVRSVEYHWTTHDAEPYDKVPLVGKATSSTKHAHVATGFRGWGMSNCTAAGIILSDEILGKSNSWSKVYNPNRYESYLSGEMLSSNVEIIGTLIKGKFAEYDEGVADLSNDEARVVEIGGDRVAVYRDEAGKLHAISANCTHMGCTVNWNNAEKSWDCPCHGSRFDYDGNVIHAPAINDLKPYEEG